MDWYRKYRDELYHYGVKGMKWGVRRTPEELGRTTKKVEKNTNNAKLNDINIYRSVGAKAKNYKVKDIVTNEYYSFVEGSKIQNAQVFAGKGSSKPLDEETALGLAEQVGGNASNWQHCKGNGILDYNGEERKAEVHWFQEETVGKHKFKVKKWLD